MSIKAIHTLYRFYDKDMTLLYVGITQRGSNRFDEHSSDQLWWQYSDTVQLEHFDTREQVSRAEKRAIKNESPVFNVQHSRRRDVLLNDYLSKRIREEYEDTAPIATNPPAAAPADFVPNYLIPKIPPPLWLGMTLEEFAALPPAWPKDVSGLEGGEWTGSRGVMVARVHDRHKRPVGDEDVIVRVLIRYPGEGLQRLTVRSCFLSGPRASGYVGQRYLTLYQQIIEQAKLLPVIEFSEVPA